MSSFTSDTEINFEAVNSLSEFCIGLHKPRTFWQGKKSAIEIVRGWLSGEDGDKIHSDDILQLLKVVILIWYGARQIGPLA